MLIDAYCNRLVLANYRPETIRARRSCLGTFAASLEGHHLAAATRLDVEAYLSRPLAPETRRAYRSHLKGFYAWAVDEGHVLTDPTLKLPTVRVPRAVPRPIHPDDLRKAVDLASPRMRAWLLLMSLAGLRCMEVAALRPVDVSVTDCGALLYLRECKGGGSATVPAHKAVLGALAVLPARDDGTWWDVTAHHVSKMTGRYLRSLGIDATGHQLRHRAGTDWYSVSGHDLLTTARLLRHASVATSQVYAQLDPVRPAEVVGLVCSPSRARLHVV